MPTPVSVVVLTCNDEASIEECLESVSWSNDVCIIDDYSEDATLKKASKFSVRIFQHKLNDHFAKQRNYALGLVKNDWVLFVDADEVVSEKLAKEIGEIPKSSSKVAYRIPRKDRQYGKEIRFGEFFKFAIVRLAKKNVGLWIGAVHEEWRIKGKVGVLSSPILHVQHGGITRFLTKVNHYSSIRAQELYALHKKSGFAAILFYPIGKFFQNYVIKFGIFDGVPGLMNAVGMSFYTFLVRAKLWLLWNERTQTTKK